ncbi:MAG: hypothetical protein ABI706_18890 [Ilumatobacteraceae bacterium]
MSNALKTMVESGASTLSDLVDEARSRIEELPPIAGPRRRKARKQFSSIALVVLIALAIVVVTKRNHRQSKEQTVDRVK